jgi:methylenetetrahydrofolate reductase (NADPH)
LREKDFAVTAELPLAAVRGRRDIERGLQVLGPVVDAVQLVDSPFGEAGVAPISAAAVAIDAGIDPVVHLNCRDRNRLALENDLRGAAALGVTSLLLLRGKKFARNHAARPKSVYDLTANELIVMAGAIGESLQSSGHTALFLGTSATAFHPAKDWAPARIERRADAGIKFLQTQPCLNIPLLKAYLAGLVAARLLQRVSVIVSLPLLRSLEDAHRLRGLYATSMIPDAVVDRIGGAGDAESEGIAVCAEAMRAVAAIPGVSGANIAFAGNPEAVPRVLEASRSESATG